MEERLLITQAQKDKLFYEALFCACYKADLSEMLPFRHDRMKFYPEDMRRLLPFWFEQNKIPIDLKYFLFEHWAMHQACLWLSEGGFPKQIYRANLINNLTIQEADFLIKKFLELNLKIKKGLEIKKVIKINRLKLHNPLKKASQFNGDL
jgi:hypothetical protein